MPGMHGPKTANMAFQEADVIISVGARFDDRVTGHVGSFAPKAKIIHLDIDPAAISKIVRVDIPVVGDAKNILAALNKLVSRARAVRMERADQEMEERQPVFVQELGQDDQAAVCDRGAVSFDKRQETF